jgi:hypothetical protein
MDDELQDYSIPMAASHSSASMPSITRFPPDR